MAGVLVVWARCRVAAMRVVRAADRRGRVTRLVRGVVGVAGVWRFRVLS
jgi:hypothetical protein